MSRRDRREELKPELTPLIDVVFLLLIFFMVSSVFKKDEWALLLELPQAQEGKGVKAEKNQKITLELTDKDLAMNGKKLTIDDLKNSLENVEKEKPIFLRVGKTVVYERLVEVLDLLQAQKLFNLTLVTEKKQ